MKILRVESTSGVELSRIKIKRRNFIKIAFRLFLLTSAIFGVIFGTSSFIKTRQETQQPVETEKLHLNAPIDDEAKTGVSERIINYSARLEYELKKASLKLEKIILPKEKTRELHIFIADSAWFYKINIMRGVGESAEDIIRMQKRFRSNEPESEKLEYVDLRISRRAYLKYHE